MRRNRAFWLAVCMIAVASPETVFAFSAQGQRWFNQPGDPVKYQLEPNASEDVTDGSDLTAVRAAFNTWQQVACSFLSFEEETFVGQTELDDNGNNKIFWVEQESDWPGQQGTIALTYTFYTLGTERRITDADIIVNGVNYDFSTTQVDLATQPPKVDLETIIFHEIGHFFGLDHSQDSNAAMFPSNNKQMQRAPAIDDVHGICALYSNGLPVDGQGQPTGGPVGAPCQAREDCASSLCVEDQTISRTYCSAQCAFEDPATCPVGYQCEETSEGALCLAPAPIDELCDQCNNGFQCSSGLCVTVPNRNNGRPFCSKLCDPSGALPQQCPGGFQCELTQQATSQINACVPSTGICQALGKGGQNEPCYGNGSCKPGFGCFEYYPNTALNYCYYLCPFEFAGRACDIENTRDICLAVQGRMLTAACFTAAFAGEPCIPEICAGNSFCAYDQTVDDALCYNICQNGQGDCPANTECTGFEELPPLCVPMAGFKYLGDSCSTSTECESQVCRVFGQAKLCTQPCSTTNATDCPNGLTCLPEANSTQGLCWPESFTDPNARDIRRDVNIVPSYCSCDTTNEYDPNYEYDPEYKGSVYSCNKTAPTENRTPV